MAKSFDQVDLIGKFFLALKMLCKAPIGDMAQFGIDILSCKGAIMHMDRKWFNLKKQDDSFIY